MSTIRPRTPCAIRRQKGTFDVNGRQNVERVTRKTKCAIVWLRDMQDATTVRADSSASRGRADETVFQSRLLFRPGEDIQKGDLVEIIQQGDEEAIVIEVVTVFRRPDVNGRVHHIQVEGDRWASA